MKILVVSEKFAPENTVAAIRMTKISKYLKYDHGAVIDVLTRVKTHDDSSSLDDISFVNHFFFAEESSFSKKLIDIYKRHTMSDSYASVRRKEINDINNGYSSSLISTFRMWLRSILAVVWSIYTAHAYAKSACRLIKRFDYDCVISSFGPEASHYIGRHFKRKNPDIVWIADYRDPLYSGEATKGLLAYWAKSFPNRITQKADAITTVSRGFIHCLNVQDRKDVYVITNGFDRDDLRFVQACAKKSSERPKMEICYVGSLLIGRRDISPVLYAIKKLIEEDIIDPSLIRIQYAGAHWKEFEAQIHDIDVPIEIVNNKKLSKLEALQLEKSADLLLMAAWNTTSYNGSLPLKLYEYMMVGKPIICIVSGNEGNSEAKKIIDNCKAGYCYETVDGEVGLEGLKQYIVKAYQAYQQGNDSKSNYFSPRMSEIEKYDYKFLSNQFASIIRKNLKTRVKQ